MFIAQFDKKLNEIDKYNKDRSGYVASNQLELKKFRDLLPYCEFISMTESNKIIELNTFFNKYWNLLGGESLFVFNMK